MSTAPSSVSLIVEHIVGYLSKRDESTPSPLFVALQGPQGSGKTYLTERVAASLSPYRVATLSIDDLYLPHSQLLELAISHPSNALLHGRGQPGTHDVPLGLSILHALKNINTSPSMSVRIPFFDKSLFGGEGDRVPESQWKSVSGPLDVVLLEGWCVGFYPQPRADVERRIGVPPLGLQDTFDMSRYALAHVLEVNARLAEYAQWWALFDVFVQVRAPAPSPCAWARRVADRAGGYTPIRAHL
ncbi:P-loop containing nucleoside triphosphate hydrolase protein [Artomyces pyxidatus]|uniref:P-loop containing nucleoside triphosphate hydrolase protein n=1 Tax=Artomyces pyxidatus TaxID=48021 RepID=A0ACB8T126_9AGAM|nr:P-loop containing nucleoside triphosphate hydrolase protein [Artomyces pyxidatus]